VVFGSQILEVILDLGMEVLYPKFYLVSLCFALDSLLVHRERHFDVDTSDFISLL
jgi:hypothetical protein